MQPLEPIQLAVIIASVREGRFGPVVSEWFVERAKPVGLVFYGGISGGLRAVEALRLVFAELHAVTIRKTVSFAFAARQFDARGEPCDPAAVNTTAAVLLAQLLWWARTLRQGRDARPYPG